MQLARAARQLYVEWAPKTERYQSTLAKIDQWLASETERHVTRSL
jgi:hypothetical protein